MKFKALKGIQDILPPETSGWQRIEAAAREIFKTYGFREIRLPVIESTEIFLRSIGETTDIVEKEMYTFTDKADRSVTLRPEGTAPFVRAFVEHHLFNEPPPQKFYYMGPMFRYERPQAGRQRQFHQIGVEALGVEDPKIDAEIISLLLLLLEKIGIKDAQCEVTSIGCVQCRPAFRAALKDFFKDRLGLFCDDCKRRYELNPLRILDCKVEACINGRQGAPSVIDFLCGDCTEHFNGVQYYLKLLSVPYTVNPGLVRGLDYYTRTAFEIKNYSLGAQNAVAAGGRYNGLVEEFGGPKIPGIGFAIGVERIVTLLTGLSDGHEGPDVFLCSLSSEAGEKTAVLAGQLRLEGLWVEISYDKSSLRSQMRRADRLRAKNVIVVGEDEMKSQTAVIKNMQDKTEISAALDAGEILRIIRGSK
ncbi:MAG: histidine--tRNA ligase [Nitrospirae bacterium]|nr:histidine--tRNA ligase [Nitrospirota bacterium]